MHNNAFAIVQINHPDDLRTSKTKYAVNSFTHRHSGRRPRQITLKKHLATPWAKAKEETSCTSQADSEKEPSKCHTQPQLTIQSSRTSTSLAMSSPVTVEFTGLRRDPFNSFPIAMQGCVEGAVDFWLKVWVPSQVTGTVLHFFPISNLNSSTERFH